MYVNSSIVASAQPVAIEVNPHYLAQVRGFDVELYRRGLVRSRRSPEPTPTLIFLDAGQWRIGRYVRWAAERAFPDFNVLDALDDLLRDFFPPGVGAVQRNDLPAPSSLGPRLTPSR